MSQLNCIRQLLACFVSMIELFSFASPTFLQSLSCPKHPANAQTTSTQNGIFHHRNSIAPNIVNNADIVPHTADIANKKTPIAMNIFLNPYTTSRSSSFISIIPTSPRLLRRNHFSFRLPCTATKMNDYPVLLRFCGINNLCTGQQFHTLPA